MNRHEKEQTESIYYVLLILWSGISTITLGTTFSDIETLHLGVIYTIFRLMIFGLLCYRTFIYSRQYSLNQFCVILLLLVIVFITFSHTRNDYFYPAVFFIISAYQINVKKAMDMILNTQIVIACITIISAVIGIIPDYTIYRGSLPRFSLGYNHPNTLGSLFLTISLITFYLYYRSDQRRVYITLVMTFIVTFFVARSRTSANLIFILLIVQFVYSITHTSNDLYDGRNAHTANGIVSFSHSLLRHTGLIFACILLFNLFATLGYIDFAKYDATMDIRFFYASNYLKHYKINLFGQDLYLGIYDNRILPDWELKNALGTLDNSYVFLLLGFGIVGFASFILSYLLRIRMAEKEREYALLVVFIILAVDGLMETALIRFFFNYFMLFFADLIWNKSEMEEIGRNVGR